MGQNLGHYPPETGLGPANYQPMRYKKIIVKIGSNVLTRPDGTPDTDRMAHLIDQVAQAKAQGVELLLVSSGAVASGRSAIQLPANYDPVARRQVLAAVGQVKLIQTYHGLFARHGLTCAQVLVTREDFRDRQHYLNMKNCLTALLQNGIVPVINENDVVSVTELMFTDNDELSGLVATMMDVEALFILSNVDGIYTAPPSQPGAELIAEVTELGQSLARSVSAEKSEFGRGGMLTKTNIARKVARLGIVVHIANGQRDGIILSLLGSQPPGSRFAPRKAAPGRKKWIAHAGIAVKGEVVVNAGAAQALRADRATSLLPVGIVRLSGTFAKGDVVRIMAEDGHPLGLGLAQYGSDKAQERLGKQRQPPLIHYDYLVLE